MSAPLYCSVHACAGITGETVKHIRHPEYLLYSSQALAPQASLHTDRPNISFLSSFPVQPARLLLIRSGLRQRLCCCILIDITIQLKGVGMADIQYVTDESGTPVAVQIPIQDWELIKAELRPYDADSETAAILEDKELYVSFMRGGVQAKRREGNPLSEISI